MVFMGELSSVGLRIASLTSSGDGSGDRGRSDGAGLRAGLELRVMFEE